MSYYRVGLHTRGVSPDPLSLELLLVFTVPHMRTAMFPRLARICGTGNSSFDLEVYHP